MSTVLKTENLSKKFGNFVAVKNLSLEILEGEVFGFLGPNGAGKTTSISMMCGLLKPDAGHVWLHGKPVANGDLSARRLVGVCPQNIVLWERLTCLEQLVFIGQMYDVPTAEARRRSEKLLADLELKDQRNQQAKTLSGGMQRRLNIAMALVHDPQIVILDEPEAGLDPQSRVKVREYIQSLARHKTVILTTHNMDEADRVADRIAIIDHGELLVLDTSEQLKKRLGEGDVIEIHLADKNGSLENALQALQAVTPQVHIDAANHSLQIRALDAAARLPVLLNTLTQAGCQPGEIAIRPNTLEDVFIQLTGRRLRE